MEKTCISELEDSEYDDFDDADEIVVAVFSSIFIQDCF